MSGSIPQYTIKKLVRDIRELIKTPLNDNGIYYIHDENNMLKGRALIIGQPNTPYFGGSYLFHLDYPVDYPYVPPKVSFHTNGNNVRFHPNLYNTGKVCLSVLNTWYGDQWSSCQSISTILLTLVSILTKNPLEHEPGRDFRDPDFYKYTQIVEFANLDIAIGYMVTTTPDKFLMFRQHIIDNFMSNFNNLIRVVEDLQIQFPIPITVSVIIYQMTYQIDYTLLLTKLKTLHSKHMPTLTTTNESYED